MGTVTMGALALSAAALVGAFVVLDDHAAQILESGSPITSPEKKSSPPARSKRPPASNNAADRAVAVSGARRPSPVQTVGSAPSANAAGPLPPQVGATGPRRVQETMLDGRHKRHAEAHRRSRANDRHMAKSSREQQQDSREATRSAQNGQGSNQSAPFFPFR
jgi:hypothetical protein